MLLAQTAILLVVASLGSTTIQLNNKTFPDYFKFGVSTSAYQIEGGWDADGKSASMFDDFVHLNPDIIQDGTNGDVACDSYHKYQEDVALLKEMGAQYYRFSISWPRILPYGTVHIVNQPGVDYYLNLLKLLKENGIEPIVTLYHWDLPTYLHEMGGWTNPELVTYFGDYARLCYQLFGEYVKYWVTLNEPQSTCYLGYVRDATYFVIAPGYSLAAHGLYLCTYTSIKAHALAYHIYEDEFKEKYQGKVSLSLVSSWYEPVDDSEDNLEAQYLAMQFRFAMWANPILVGDWPEEVNTRVTFRSLTEEGLPESRLPQFTTEEIEYIKGTFDWVGINYYTTFLTRRLDDSTTRGNASYIYDEGFTSEMSDTWKSSNSSTWLKQHPEGLLEMLRYVHQNFNQPEIIITENGWSEDGSSLNDTDRIEYVGLHLSTILDAIDEGINVTGYTQWSLLDNFEWSYGYSAKFGVVSVDFQSENRTRTPKESFYWYQKVIKERRLTA